MKNSQNQFTIKHGKSEGFGYLPDTTEQARQAQENRTAIAEVTRANALKIHDVIKKDGPLQVDLGGQLKTIISNTGLLDNMRVKIFKGQEEVSSFYYPGLTNAKQLHGGEPHGDFLIDELITHEDPDDPESPQVSPVGQEPVYLNQAEPTYLKSPSLSTGPYGYTGGPHVTEYGSEDYVMFASVMAQVSESLDAQVPAGA